MTLNLVSELREQMLNTIQEQTLIEYLRDQGAKGVSEPLFETPDGSCRMGFSSTAKVSSPASNSTLLAISDIAAAGLLAEQVVEALEFLINDRNSAVALTSLIILDRLGATSLPAPVRLQGLAFHELALSGSHQIAFKDSLVSNFSCESCVFEARGSILLELNASISSYWGLIRTTDQEEDYSRGIIWINSGGYEIPREAIPLTPTEAFEERPDFHWETFILANNTEQACTMLKSISDESELVSMWE
jgi:hypothetical protein